MIGESGTFPHHLCKYKKEKTLVVPQTVTELRYGLAVPMLDIYPGEIKIIYSYDNLKMGVHSSTIDSSQKMKITHVSITDKWKNE